jgi:hypothetical protein
LRARAARVAGGGAARADELGRERGLRALEQRQVVLAVEERAQVRLDRVRVERERLGPARVPAVERPRAGGDRALRVLEHVERGRVLGPVREVREHEEQLLDLALERLQAQAVDGVLETRVLAAVNA